MLARLAARIAEREVDEEHSGDAALLDDVTGAAEHDCGDAL